MRNSHIKALVGALAVLAVGGAVLGGAIPASADTAHNGSGHNGQTPGVFPADGVVVIGSTAGSSAAAPSAFRAFFEPAVPSVDAPQTHELSAGHSGR